LWARKNPGCDTGDWWLDFSLCAVCGRENHCAAPPRQGLLRGFGAVSCRGGGECGAVQHGWGTGVSGLPVLAKPMLDLAYNPIEMSVIDAVAGIEGRSEYAYFLNHEFALFAGRFLGCVLFLAIDACWSGTAALKYALPVVAILQLLSMQVAGMVSRK